MRALCGWRVTDEDVVLVGDASFLEDTQQLRVHSECFHRFSLVFLALEVFGKVRQHVVLRDDVDAFDGPDEIVELPAGPANHVSDDVVDRFGAVRVDTEEPREVTILRVEWDDEWF